VYVAAALEVLASFVYFDSSPFLGYLVQNKISMNSYIMVLASIKIAYAFGLVAYVSAHTTLHALTFGIYHFALGLLSLINYLDLLKRAWEKSTIRRRSCISLSTKNIEVAILVEHYNELFSYRYFIRAILPAIPIPISFLYVVLKFHDQLHVPTIAISLMISVGVYSFFECILLAGANVWVRSSNLLQNMERVAQIQSKITLRRTRTLRCLRPLRVKIGDNNFIEACTPLVFISFSLEKIATIMCFKL